MTSWAHWRRTARNGLIPAICAVTALATSCGTDSEPPPTATSLTAPFVIDAFTRNWADDGKAAAAVFAFGEGDAVVNNPNSTVDVETARRTGATMWQVGGWLSTSGQWQNFKDLGDGETAGARNPEAVRTLAVSMSPYLGAMLGEYSNEVLPGFRPEPGQN